MNTYSTNTTSKSQPSSSSSMYRRFTPQQSQQEPIIATGATIFNAPSLDILVHRKRNSNEHQRQLHDIAATRSTSYYENYRYRDNVTTAVASRAATEVDTRSTSYTQHLDDDLDYHDNGHSLPPVTPKQSSRLLPLQIRGHIVNRGGSAVQGQHHSHNNGTAMYENDHRFHPHHYHHHQMKVNTNSNESYQHSPNIIDDDYNQYHYDHLDYNNVHNESDIDRDVHMFRDDHHDPMLYDPYNNQQPPYQHSSHKEGPAITVLRESYSSQKISAIVSPMYNYEDRKLVSSGPSSVASSRWSNSTQQQSWEESVHPPPFASHNNNNSSSSSSSSSNNNNNNNNGYSKYNRGMKNDQYQRYEYQQVNGNFHQPYNRHPIPSYADDIAGTTNYEKKQGTSNFAAYQHPSRNDGRSNRNLNTASSRYSYQPEMKQTKMIEITPGYRLRLRDSDETLLAIQNDYYIPCSCAICSSSSDNEDCSEPLFCIEDAEYFICPTCKSLNRLLEAENGTTDQSLTSTGKGKGVGGGVGLGFTMTTLNAMQKQIVSNFHHTVHQMRQHLR